ncbi:MAG: prepilin-type N-terminal cleavage/methylation domain-containing protein [Solirubrobacteraceae bacterium]|nr:prepilin-type N-terminal cleavage/methylation domain-containing protein [Solirubrobacteraceae bacterium]
MSRRRNRPRARDDAGFTLVEMLVTMSIATVVLFAILQSADVFSRSAESSRDLADTQDTGRATLRVLVAELRQTRPSAPGAESPIVTVGGGAVSRRDLIAATYLPDSAQGAPGWVRYCVSADGRSLYAGHATGSSLPTPLPACGTDGGGWTHELLVDDRLRDPNVFSYVTDADTGGAACQPTAPADAVCLPSPADVRGIGLRLSIADRPSDADARTVLQGAVSLRNRSPA